MFGYSTVLRSLTQGKAQFTMEFFSYKTVPASITEAIIRKVQEEKNMLPNDALRFGDLPERKEFPYAQKRSDPAQSAASSRK
jgi:hypothetical protein